MAVLCHIVNVSLETSQFPSELRKTIISPVLQKPSLNRQELGSYRPVFNLSYLGKLIERVTSSQVTEFTVVCIAQRQPFLPFRIISLELLIEKKLCFFWWLICLPRSTLLISPSFLQRFRDECGLCGAVGRWFKSYLCGRSCQVNSVKVLSLPRPSWNLRRI